MTPTTEQKRASFRALHRQGWGRVLETRPALPDVLRTLESLH